MAHPGSAQPASSPRAPSQDATVKRPDSAIVFIRTDRLGETLLNLPAVAAIKAAFPRSRVTFVANPELVELLTLVPSIDALIADWTSPGPWWWHVLRLAAQLRKGRFRIAIVSNPTKASHLAVFLAGIPVRVGYARKWPWTLTHRVGDHKALGERHEVEYNLELLTALGISVPAVSASPLPVSEHDASEVTQLLGRHAVHESDWVVAVHPWTSNPAKQWPLARFGELIRRVRAVPGVVVVVIGGQEERAQAQAWREAQHLEVIDTVGQLSLRQLAVLLHRARVLVSNDSGPVHLATAVGTPTIALFGTEDPAASPRRWGPWGTGHTVIWKPTMDAIEVEEIVQAVRRYLPCLG